MVQDFLGEAKIKDFSQTLSWEEFLAQFFAFWLSSVADPVASGSY